MAPSGVRRRRAQAAASLVERLAHAARAFEISAVSTSPVAPQATGSRASSSVCGKFAHQIDVVQRREHRALFAVPAPHQIEQVGGRSWHRWR